VTVVLPAFCRHPNATRSFLTTQLHCPARCPMRESFQPRSIGAPLLPALLTAIHDTAVPFRPCQTSSSRSSSNPARPKHHI
jgi:hypothetical protein